MMRHNRRMETPNNTGIGPIQDTQSSRWVARPERSEGRVGVILTTPFTSFRACHPRLLPPELDPPRLLRRGPEKAEAHLVGRLLAEEHRPRRREGVVRILVAVVVDRLDIEA